LVLFPRRPKATRGRKGTKASKANGRTADNGATASAGPGYPEGWVPLNTQESQESWRGVADREYIQDMYTRSMYPVDYDWDEDEEDEDEMSEDEPEEHWTQNTLYLYHWKKTDRMYSYFNDTYARCPKSHNNPHNTTIIENVSLPWLADAAKI
jgi:hypothetical protein